MQVFELHFNPKARENTVFDSFCYKPGKLSEKKLGDLYIVGKLNNLLPQNAQLLRDVAHTIKKEYYFNSQRTPDRALEAALKKANQNLQSEAQAGNVSWMGNLNFCILSFKDFILNFAKVGNIQILLTRATEIINIGENLEFQDTEPYPLKVFGNIASGKLALGDNIVVLTKEIFDGLERENLIKLLPSVSSQKQLQEILNSKRKKLSRISGVLLFAQITPEIQFQSRLGFSLNKKTALIGFLIVVLGLGCLIFGREREKELQKANQIISQTQSKVIQAESFLILKEEEKAKHLLQEALEEILPLTKAGKPLREQALQLKNSIQKQFSDLK